MTVRVHNETNRSVSQLHCTVDGGKRQNLNCEITQTGTELFEPRHTRPVYLVYIQEFRV